MQTRHSRVQTPKALNSSHFNKGGVHFLYFCQKYLAMQTIRLKVSDKIIGNLMWFLRRFSSDEIEILSENNEFLSVQEYLENELVAMESGQPDYINIDELEKHLEKSIRKYED